MDRYGILTQSNPVDEFKGFVDNMEGEIRETTLRLKMWWLTTFKGYIVRYVGLRPRRTMFGSVICRRLWRLEKR